MNNNKEYIEMEWKMITGEFIKIKDMTDLHLKNSKFFLENTNQEYCAEYKRICDEIELRNQDNKNKIKQTRIQNLKQMYKNNIKLNKKDTGYDQVKVDLDENIDYLDSKAKKGKEILRRIFNHYG